MCGTCLCCPMCVPPAFAPADASGQKKGGAIAVEVRGLTKRGQFVTHIRNSHIDRSHCLAATPLTLGRPPPFFWLAAFHYSYAPLALHCSCKCTKSRDCSLFSHFAALQVQSAEKHDQIGPESTHLIRNNRMRGFK